MIKMQPAQTALLDTHVVVKHDEKTFDQTRNLNV